MKSNVSSFLTPNDSSSILWATNDDYNYYNNPTKIKGLVTTSSWQRLALAAIDAKYNDVITPAVHEFEREARETRLASPKTINFIWAGDPSDGTLMMLASILDALDIKYALTAMIVGKIDHRTETHIKDNSNILVLDFNAEDFYEALLSSHIYATPSMSMHSFDMFAANAYASGCFVVAPNHSGYTEMLSKFGFLSPYTRDNHLYASAFGAKILDAVSLLSNPDSNSYRRSQTGMCELMYEDTVKQKWSQFEEFMSLEDA
jgi:glycosyltransferase involved in cell wall biosynthesis